MNLSNRYSSSDALCFSPDDEADFFLIDAYLSSNSSNSKTYSQPPLPPPPPTAPVSHVRHWSPEETREDFRPVHVPKHQASSSRTSALTSMIALAAGSATPRTVSAHVTFKESDDNGAAATDHGVLQLHRRSNSVSSVDSAASLSLFRDVPSRPPTPARARGGTGPGGELFSLCADGAMAAVSRAVTNLVTAARAHHHPQPL